MRDITQQLRDKKVKLQPQIRELKEARKRFQDIEANYFQKRSTYEKVGRGSDGQQGKSRWTGWLTTEWGCCGTMSRWRWAWRWRGSSSSRWGRGSTTEVDE